MYLEIVLKGKISVYFFNIEKHTWRNCRYLWKHIFCIEYDDLFLLYFFQISYNHVESGKEDVINSGKFGKRPILNSNEA